MCGSGAVLAFTRCGVATHDEMLAALRSSVGDLVLRLGSRVHAVIAVIAFAVIAVDALTYQSFKTVSGGFFDTLIALRPSVPEPDPKIVIVDIDEGSLAQVGKTHGRWPWPNEVFADVLYTLEKHQVKQIAFDIMFSDADVLRPQSEKKFNAAVSDIGNRLPVHFPMVRLNPSNDAKSQIPTGALPGARSVADAGKQTSTIAIILPQVPAALDQGRLAFLNVYPDRDSVIRQYPMGLAHDGWAFDSYAVSIARAANNTVNGHTSAARGVMDTADQSKTFWLNWRGPAFSYRYISIKDLLSGSSDKSEFTELLRGATVIIGATAPALQDLKSTPVGAPYPGVEILATAIDNVKNDDSIQAAPGWLGGLVAAGFIVVLGYLFTQGFKPDQINLVFLGIQVALVGLAWLMLAFFNYFLNFAGAVTYGAAFFAIAKISTLQLLPLGREALFRRMCAQAPTHAIVVALDVDAVSPKILRYVNEQLVLRGQERGWLMAAALEPDEDAGAFGAAFYRVLVFTRFVSAADMGGALIEQMQKETSDVVCRELDKVCPQRKVNRMVVSLADISGLAPEHYRRLGSFLYARGANSVFTTEST